MTVKTRSVSDGRSLERALFDPKGITQICRRLCRILICRVALRIICPVTDRAAFFGPPASPRPRCIHKTHRTPRGPRNDINMFVMWKSDREIRSGSFSFGRLVEYLSRVRKCMSGTVSRRRICMADRTDRRPRASEKLLPVTVKTRLVFRVLSNIRKRFGAGPYLIPIGRWKFVTRAAFHAVSFYIVRKL